MKASRLLVLAVVLVAAVCAGWYLTHRPPSQDRLTIYYTKASNGTSLGEWSVSLRSPGSGESAAEHLHDLALYAAVSAVAGPPSQVDAIRFPPGTHVQSVRVDGTTAVVDLSPEVTRGAGGTFGENGEFKSLVYTVTGVPGIAAVQVTIDGKTMETLPGGHVELDQPLHRADF